MNGTDVISFTVGQWYCIEYKAPHNPIFRGYEVLYEKKFEIKECIASCYNYGIFKTDVLGIQKIPRHNCVLTTKPKGFWEKLFSLWTYI